MKNRTCAIVLGGYVNAYSIIQELYHEGINDIALIQHGRYIAGFSRYIKYKYTLKNSPESILDVLSSLKEHGYERFVFYPTDDLHLENLLKLYQEIKDYTFLPFNHDNLLEASDKFVQYEKCEELGIPFPKTIRIETEKDLEKLESIEYPVLIKPNRRDDLKIKVFRSLELNSKEEYESKREIITNLISRKVGFIASELIPGSTNGTIFAYTAYRSPKTGEVLNEWIGGKLSQFPGDFGVFSSAINKAPEIIRAQGRALLDGLDLYGICEPEFKYDARDGRYKLMEINLRSMMWHRMGNLSGVKLQVTQWEDAHNLSAKFDTQKTESIHFAYLKYEVINLFSRRQYFNIFKNNLFGGERNYLAVFDRNDLKPFLYNLYETLKELIKLFMRKLKNQGGA